MNENDERPPVIWENGVKTFGDEDMMKMMVQNFEPMSFDGVMKDLSNEIQNENWSEVKRHAHTMKGSSSYIGADRFSEVCLLLQNAAMTGDLQEIYTTYEKVLKEGKILKNYLAKLIEKTPDTTEVDKYIMAFEKLKKSKKINTTKNPTTDATEAQKSKDKNKNASVSNTKKNEKPKVEENKEQSAPLKLEKKPTKEKKENGLSNINKPQPSILESGDVSADKACCKQCRIF